MGLALEELTLQTWQTKEPTQMDLTWQAKGPTQQELNLQELTWQTKEPTLMELTWQAMGPTQQERTWQKRQLFGKPIVTIFVGKMSFTGNAVEVFGDS